MAKYQVVATAYKLGDSENKFFLTQKAATQALKEFANSGMKTQAYRMLTMIDLRKEKKIMRQYSFVTVRNCWKKIKNTSLLNIDAIIDVLLDIGAIDEKAQNEDKWRSADPSEIYNEHSSCVYCKQEIGKRNVYIINKEGRYHGMMVHHTCLIRIIGEWRKEKEEVQNFFEPPIQVDTYYAPQGVGGTSYQTSYERDRYFGKPE